MEPREPFLEKVRTVGAGASTTTAFEQHQVEKLSLSGLLWIRALKASGIHRVDTSEGISKCNSIGSYQGRMILLCNFMQDLN